jgi:hypothetical protein
MNSTRLLASAVGGVGIGGVSTCPFSLSVVGRKTIVKRTLQLRVGL